MMMGKNAQTLPSTQELTPLSQILISPELANAFSITFESSKTPADVLRASQSTINVLQQQLLVNSSPPFSSSKHNLAKDRKCWQTDSVGANHGKMENVCGDQEDDEEAVGNEAGGGDVMEAGDVVDIGFSALNTPYLHLDDPNHEMGVAASSNAWASSTKMPKRIHVESLDSEGEDSDANPGDESGTRALKRPRPRLVWTPQLHKRFVDAVAHLGVKNAVPKTIMQLMNVEGLTRENVASHLQKYRLYMKRTQGATTVIGAVPFLDPLFSSTPLPPGLVQPAHYFPYSLSTAPMMPLPPGCYGSFEHHPYGATVQASAQGMTPAEHVQQTDENQEPANSLSHQNW